MEFEGIAKLIESVGFPGLIFVVWYIYHRSQAKQWEGMMVNQAKQLSEMMVNQQQSWLQLLGHMEKKNDQTFELLKDSMQTIQAHTMILARIENKVDSMRNNNGNKQREVTIT